MSESESAVTLEENPQPATADEPHETVMVEPEPIPMPEPEPNPGVAHASTYPGPEILSAENRFLCNRFNMRVPFFRRPYGFGKREDGSFAFGPVDNFSGDEVQGVIPLRTPVCVPNALSDFRKGFDWISQDSTECYELVTGPRVVLLLENGEIQRAYSRNSEVTGFGKDAMIAEGIRRAVRLNLIPKRSGSCYGVIRMVPVYRGHRVYDSDERRFLPVFLSIDKMRSFRYNQWITGPRDRDDWNEDNRKVGPLSRWLFEDLESQVVSWDDKISKRIGREERGYSTSYTVPSTIYYGVDFRNDDGKIRPEGLVFQDPMGRLAKVPCSAFAWHHLQSANRLVDGIPELQRLLRAREGAFSSVVDSTTMVGNVPKPEHVAARNVKKRKGDKSRIV